MHDLTAEIVKEEPWYFAQSDSANLWKGRWTKKGSSSSVKVAVKVPIARGPGSDVEATKEFLREANIWAKATHPNITPFIGISYNFDRPGVGCLVFPYYRHGDITNYLQSNPYVSKLALITQITRALSFLHGLSIVHGDIKASNILINDSREACLADFGQSRILRTSGFGSEAKSSIELIPMTTTAWRWRAPELINVRRDASEAFGRVTTATDVWACAMTMTEIFTGSIPFSYIKSDAKVVLYVMAGGHPHRQYYPLIDDDVWTTLEKCWRTNSRQRIAMDSLANFFARRSQ